MAKMNKAMEKQIKESMKTILDTAVGSAQAAAGVVKDPTLEEMKKYYETVDVKIQKKNTKSGRFEHFLTLLGQKTEDLDAIGLDEICKAQGQGGTYKVAIRPPDVKSWTKAQTFGPIDIAGPGHSVAKLELEQQGMLPNATMAGMVNPMGYMAPPNQSGNHIPDLLEYVKSSNVSNTLQQQQGQDRMMLLMQQSADKQAQAQQAMMLQMSQVFAAMVGNNKNSQSDYREREETRQLREEMRRLEDQRRADAQRRADEQIAELNRRIEENKTTVLLETLKAGQKDDGKEAIFAAMLTGIQNSANSQNNNYMGLLKEFMQRPSDDERMSNVMNSAMNMTQQQMQMLSTAVQSGLLNQGGEASPAVQAVLGIIDGLTRVGEAAFTGKGGSEEGEQPDPQAAQYPQMPPVQEAPLLQGTTGAYETGEYQAPEGFGHIADYQEAQVEPMTPSEAPPPPPPVKLFDEADLSRVARDTALARVLATLTNGLPVGEATARLYAHKNSGNDLAERWMQNPYEISSQVLRHFDLDARTEEFAANIISFTELVDNNEHTDELVRYINEWSGTGYQPIKVVKAANPQSVTSIAPDAPEFGSKRGAPATGEEYDPSIPPPGKAMVQLAPEEQPVEAPVTPEPEPVQQEELAPPVEALEVAPPPPEEELPIAKEVPAIVPPPPEEITPAE